MEHTHLVKGLDYSLLHKVRGEIERSHTNDDQEDLEKAYVSYSASFYFEIHSRKILSRQKWKLYSPHPQKVKWFGTYSRFSLKMSFL